MSFALSRQVSDTVKRMRSEGRSHASPRLSSVEAVARALAIIGCVFFALSACWGIGGLIGAGHYAAMSSYGIIADNMLRWGTVGPVWDYVASPPSRADWYCHHPFGTFWTSTALRALLGRHDWLLPLPAVLMSAATPPLLYKTAKRAWGTIPGAAAVLGFVFLPITLGFANFNALEVPAIFGFSLFFYGHVHMLATARRRYLLASLLGAFFSCGSDWAAWLVLAVVLAWGMLRAFALPKWMTPAFPHRLYATWWAWSVAIAIGALALWVGLFVYAGKLSDWLGSGTWRSSGGGLSNLPQALQARKFWIESSFAPHTIFIGKLAAIVALLRFFFYRKDAEVYSLAILFGATVQYVAFKHGADVHIFWPHYFGAYYALALAQLVATSEAGVRRFGGWLSLSKAGTVASALALSVATVPTLVLLPDGVRSLRYARETGGRFNEHGRLIRSDMDAVIVGRHITSQLPDDAIVDVHPSMGWGWHHEWATNRPYRKTNWPTQRHDQDDPVFFVRASALTPDQQRTLAGGFYVEAYDDIWVARPNRNHALIEGFTLSEREPSLLERYFISGVEPVRTIVADPFVTWELRTLLGQPAPLPDIEPASLDQRRIAHNIALFLGDEARATELRAEIEAALSRDVGAQFTHGLRLVGTRVIEGVKPRLEVWFSLSEQLAGAPVFNIHSVVEAKKTFGFIPPDPTERKVSPPPSLSPTLFPPGALFQQTVTLRQRIGKERYFGWFTSRGAPAPVREDGKAVTDLLTLP